MNSIGQLLLNGVVAGFGYGLMAVSFWLIYRLTHFFHFSHGAVFAVGAFVAFSVSFEQHPILATVAAIVGCGTLGALLELLIYMPLRRRNTSSVVLLIVSMGFLVIIQNILAMIFGDRLRLLPTSTRATVELAGLYVTPAQLMIVATSVIASIAIGFTLRLTTTGRLLRAVDCDDELATIVGINVPAVTACVFSVGSALAGAAGVLSAADVGLRPTMGFNALLMGMVAMIIGNSGGVIGCILSALLIGVTQQLSSLAVDTKWQDAIVFSLLVMFLLARPKGLAWAAR